MWLSVPWIDGAMAVEMGVGETSRSVDRCFVQKVQDLGYPLIFPTDFSVRDFKKSYSLVL